MNTAELERLDHPLVVLNSERTKPLTVVLSIENYIQLQGFMMMATSKIEQGE